MPHHTPLIAVLVGGLCLAFLFGALAQRLRLPPLAGYLMAGVVLGPFTPGFVADQGLADQLAEVGVILLMFGVGLHFSVKDLMEVRRIAIPGALGQIVLATAMGWGLGLAFGWSHGAALVFGLALSVASTVVLLKALQDQGILDSDRGRIAVGWLIVEDLVMVLALVLLPGLAPAAAGTAAGQWTLVWSLGETVLKVTAFIALMLVVGRRVIPWALDRTAQTGSKELFRLAVLAIALGVAFGSAYLFDVSFALGAFFAGTVLGESELSHEAAEETVPLRDAFAVLFFVSIGMLFDPWILVKHPWAVAGTVLIVVLGKSLAAFLIVRLFGHPSGTGLTISASLAQIGEFSFILAGLGVALKLLPPDGRSLILAGAMLSILLNPLLFRGLNAIGRRTDRADGSATASTAGAENAGLARLKNHAVLVGYGRVGRRVSDMLLAERVPVVVIEDRLEIVRDLRQKGLEVLCGSGLTKSLLQQAHLDQALHLLIAIPNPFEAAQVAELARTINPRLGITARAHSGTAVRHLAARGVDHVIMGEHEIARGMADWVKGRTPSADPAPAAGIQAGNSPDRLP
ncbi:MAG TPA: YbaL family putative K(+) efflux transporter [Ramlibacter sp.]